MFTGGGAAPALPFATAVCELRVPPCGLRDSVSSRFGLRELQTGTLLWPLLLKHYMEPMEKGKKWWFCRVPSPRCPANFYQLAMPLVATNSALEFKSN